MKTSKSPKDVLKTAYAIGLEALPTYAHPCSPKKFTQPQLFACLVLKEFLQLDYRKLAMTLSDSPGWMELLELKQRPHFTTLHKASQRLLHSRKAQQLLNATVKQAKARGPLKKKVSLATMDGSGWETHHASVYYVQRCDKDQKNQRKHRRKHFPKAGLICDTATHFILGIETERGPGPDILHFDSLLKQALARIRIETLVADAGYDAEHTHWYARYVLGVRTLIPPKIGRSKSGKPRGYWRRKMAERLHLTRYSQRSQSETVNSMLKRLQGAALRARNDGSQSRELVLRAITHNVLILRQINVFYRAWRE